MTTSMTAALLIVAAAGSAGCSSFCVQGNGDVVVDVREIAAFHSVRMSSGIDLRGVVAGKLPAQKIELETDDNLLGLIRTEVVGGTLVIERIGRDCLDPSGPLIVFAVLGDLESLEVDGSGDCVSEQPIRSASLQIDIDGSGNVSCTDVEVDRLVTTIDGSGDMTLAGRADEQVIRIDGSGDIDTTRLEATRVRVEIDGSGDVDLCALERLEVEIDGSGDVTYRGDPELTQHIDGSGTVRGH